ncbi:hypothetical protein E4U55_000496 [Claviceps digitariae]|nr:hypothetical protein E4U55_000496 [Claviceps digitariae]
MPFVSCLRNQYLSWHRSTPLPTNLENISPVFQPWNVFDATHERWTSVQPAETHTNSTRRKPECQGESPPVHPDKFSLVTWNIDSSSAAPSERMAAVLSNIAHSTPSVDIIFLQEVSRQALRHILADAHIRTCWYSSEPDDDSRWHAGQLFATMTLLSKRRFAPGHDASPAFAKLGPLWRLKYPSRFGRDALCCDVFVPSNTTPGSVSAPDCSPHARLRLINVHLDSLPIKPSRRPQQISTVASLLRCAGRGLVAGDFNPVLPEDSTLVADNHLVDAWIHLRGSDPGFTWGIDGQAPFPPSRLDKVAVLGLHPQSIDLMHPAKVHLCPHEPRTVDASIAGENSTMGHESRKTQQDEQAVPWSDHSGIKCSFALVDD